MNTFCQLIRFSAVQHWVRLTFLVTVMFCGVTVRAAEWSPWERLNNELSISFSQVNAHVWTWRFLNTGHEVIEGVEFEYTDKDGRHQDSCYHSMKPGQHVGGWAEVGYASSPPTVRILKIVHRGDP